MEMMDPVIFVFFAGFATKSQYFAGEIPAPTDPVRWPKAVVPQRRH